MTTRHVEYYWWQLWQTQTKSIIVSMQSNFNRTSFTWHHTCLCTITHHIICKISPTQTLSSLPTLINLNVTFTHFTHFALSFQTIYLNTNHLENVRLWNIYICLHINLWHDGFVNFMKGMWFCEWSRTMQLLTFIHYISICWN